jgi:hypothetical protein
MSGPVPNRMQPVWSSPGGKLHGAENSVYLQGGQIRGVVPFVGRYGLSLLLWFLKFGAKPSEGRAKYHPSELTP